MSTQEPVPDSRPYVGANQDDARRSLAEQIHGLVLARVGPRPDLNQVRMTVGSESWLAAIALLDLSPVLANDAARFAEWSRGGGRYTYTGDGEDRASTFHPDAEMDWEAWVADVQDSGRGWSSTESRLYQLVAALVVHGQQVTLPGVLDGLGSWEKPALDVLVQWASGGNNRERPAGTTLSNPPSTHNLVTKVVPRKEEPTMSKSTPTDGDRDGVATRSKAPAGEKAVTMTLPVELWQRVRIEALTTGEDAKNITAQALLRELDRRDRRR